MTSWIAWFLFFFAVVNVPPSKAQELPFLVFNGILLNDLGEPVPGAQVQFWQTDQAGNYNHPAQGGVTLDPNFQYFGTATSAEDGSFFFLTRRPGLYSARPVTHIHCKVWVNGTDVFTTQFYFADENTSFSNLLQLELEEVLTSDGDSAIKTFATNKTMVIDLGLGGDFGPLTPSQAAGPFYPRVDFFDFDSNMVNVTLLERPGTPVPTDSPSSVPSSAPSSSSTAESSASPTVSNTDDSSRSSTTDDANSSNSSSSLVDIGLAVHVALLMCLASTL